MDIRHLSTDPITGVETWHHYDDQTDETRIIYTADDTPLLEQNKMLQNDTGYTQAGIKQEFWKYASFPPGVQVKWLIEYGIDVWNRDHYDRITKLLEDPQWRHLKCTTRHHRLKGA